MGLWVRLATRYRDEPTVAGYDLLNEPLPQRTGAAAQYKDQLEPLYKRITQAIREVDKRHMITLEGADWANDWSVFTKPFDGNLFYQFHYYCWDRPTNLRGIDQFLKYRDQFNAPVWVGETGEKDNTIYWGTMQYFEAHNIGWSFWPWKKMETRNTPYSIKAPEGWQAVTAYSRGRDKPSKEGSQKAFDQLLQNIRIENCVFFPDVVNAMFRRVPGRVEAENYGHEGPDKSYGVADPAKKAELYRTSEPVPVVAVGEGSRQRGQAVQLGPKEWTAYTVNSLAARDYEGCIRVKAVTSPATCRLSVNGRTTELAVSSTDWAEIKAAGLRFNEGENAVRLEVQTGTVCVDWLDFQ